MWDEVGCGHFQVKTYKKAALAGGALKVNAVTADLFKQDALYSGEDLLRVEIREGFQN